MPARPHRPLHAIIRAEPAIPALRFLESVPGARDGEEILARGADQPGFRREQLNVIGNIQPGFEKARQTLLGVTRGTGENLAESIDVTRGRSHLDAWIERGNVRRHRATARTAGSADPFRVHLRSRNQIVESALGVPDPVAGETLAQQQRLRAQRGVLLGGTAQQRPMNQRRPRLDPLALADRVKRQHHKALQRQVRRNLLRRRLALIPVAKREKYGGVPTGRVRNIEIRRDLVVRQTVENHLVDGITAAAQRAGHAGVQRAVVIRQSAQRRQDRLPDLRLPGARVSRASHRTHFRLARAELFLRRLIHPRREDVASLRRRPGRNQEREDNKRFTHGVPA